MKTKFIVAGLLGIAAIAFLTTRTSHAQTANPEIFTGRDMTIGSTGADVVLLQGLLSEMGYLNVPITVPFGYFGPLTQKALASYQQSLGVSPSAGYFGPITKQSMHQQFAAKNWIPLLGYAQ